MTLDEMRNLSQLNGGRVVAKAKDFGNKSSIRVVIIDQKSSNITSHAIKEMEKAYIHSVNVAWFLDSLACYDKLSLKEYALIH